MFLTIVPVSGQNITCTFIIHEGKQKVLKTPEAMRQVMKIIMYF